MYFWLTCILLGCASVSSAEPINVMTFNIRYGAANDGDNSWEHRKNHVIETILNAQPAAIAIQEALIGQITFIEEQLPQYKKVGVHRDGNTQGEFSMQVNTLINWISGLVSWLAAISSVALIVTIMSDFTVLADSGIENIAEGIEVIALIGAKIVGGFYLMLVAIFLKR